MFGGWYNGSTPWNFATTVTTDMTLTAKWGSPAVIITHPQGASLNVGGSHTMSVVATGTNLRYQWYKNGALISSGGTTDTYVISSATPGDAGSYTVSVTADIGSTLTSSAAVVTVTNQGSSGGTIVNDSSISPKTAAPVRNSDGEHDDLIITLTANGNTLNNLTLGGKNLVRGTDYTVNGSTITIKGAFLDTLAAGTHTIVFDMNGGADPTLALTILGEAAETPWVNPFIDVFENDWFYDDVKYVHQNGLFAGTSANTFSPQMPMSRAMVFTVLARMAGIETEGGETWYSLALEWAVETGLTDGTNPEENVTREQLVTLLWRSAGSPSASTALDFPDADSVSDYAAEAMVWAVSLDILNGDGNGVLNPLGEATRAEVAAVLHRFIDVTE